RRSPRSASRSGSSSRPSAGWPPGRRRRGRRRGCRPPGRRRRRPRWRRRRRSAGGRGWPGRPRGGRGGRVGGWCASAPSSGCRLGRRASWRTAGCPAARTSGPRRGPAGPSGSAAGPLRTVVPMATIDRPFGRHYEDFEVGDVYRHWPGKTITEYDDHLFCMITMNHHPLHTNAWYAENDTPQKQNVVVGNLVYSLVLGMSVPDVSGAAVANLEVESLKHARPTYHGDTIYAVTRVLDKKET